ncbi:MAG: hypothetical protein RRY78_02620 [Clostridia bacterium]
MKILAFDIESCNGKHCNCASMCSFGYYLTDEKFDKIEQLDVLINPKPNRFVLGPYGEEPRIKLAYPEETFRKSPNFFKQYKQIKALFTSDVLVVGFDIVNDLRYLNDACATYNLPVITFKFIDVQLLFKIFQKDNKTLSLTKIAQYFNIDFEEHRSDEDARVTLIALQKICAEENKTLKELISYYMIVLGENKSDSFSNCYSKAVFVENFGLKRTKKMNEFLVEKYLRALKAKPVAEKDTFFNKRFCFSKSLENIDALVARKILHKIYYLGGKYTNIPQKCNVFVYDTEKECSRYTLTKELVSKGKKIEIIDEKTFLDNLGALPDLKFNDAETLSEMLNTI